MNYITSSVRSFCKQKRVWIKAVNVLIELVLLRLEDITPKERDIFKYEFTINFMSKRTLDEAFRYVKESLGLIAHYENFIKHQVLPCLERKSTQQDLHKLPQRSSLKRESHFLQQEFLYLQSLLDGSDTLSKNREPDTKLNSRHNKLLMPSKVETVPDLDETKIKQLMTKFAPKNDEEFKNVFLKWIRHFMAKYLMKSVTPF